MRILIAIAAAILVYLLVQWSRYTQRRKKQRLVREAMEQEQLRVYIADQLSAIHEAVHRFPTEQNDEYGYFNNHMLLSWKQSVQAIYEMLDGKTYYLIGLESADVDCITRLLEYYKNGESYRKAYNQQFVKRELEKYNQYFDQVENRKLDIQQRTAIVTNEDNNLIIAGAGSGKTTTIVGKVGYLLQRYQLQPSDILLISFTNQSASTLAQRINIPGVTATTFHKFGKDVITEVEQKQPGIFDEKQYKQLITGFFKDLIQDPAYLNKVTLYFTDFLKMPKSQDEFKNQGEYIQYLKDQNFSTYKTRTTQYRERVTYKREVVKSIEECRIANFLLFNNIEYEYELPYEHETATQKHRQYKPDFTLLVNGEKIYLEHFAINKEGSVPAFFANAENGQTVEEATKEYLAGISWKRELHQKHHTKLLETYSHEMSEQKLFQKLAKNLADAGVTLKPMPPEEIWNIISEAAKDEIDNFIRLFQTFITLLKSNNHSSETIRQRNATITSKFHQQRNSLFLEIIWPIYDRYQQYLSRRKEIDFSDMINKAVDYISTGRYERAIRYIIVDEFQDISIGRYQLIKAIKKVYPACRLFCVGDDWQSIYRFSGSDIALFKDFENYFGCSEKIKIETTYRFHEPLIKLSSEFILKNPNQTAKELKSLANNKSSRFQIVYSDSENQDDTDVLQRIFTELLQSGMAEGREILILGRYSFDIDRIKNEQNVFHIDKTAGTVRYPIRNNQGKRQYMAAQFMTVHRSKGLEADIVIVINCNSGKHGFPSGVADDPSLNLLLSEADQYENGEERRLFYVAMTRAKEYVYFVADASSKSKFIAELETGDGGSTAQKCPRCKTADLVVKTGVTNGKEWVMYGCSNYQYGCEFKKWG